jgi:hypothetical protein
MAAPLKECTKQQQSMIRRLWSDGGKSSDIYGRMMVQYGDSCMIQRKIKKRRKDSKESGRKVLMMHVLENHRL